MVGHSAGAMVAVLAANKRPEMFSRLVLIGASPCYRNLGEYHGGFDQASLDELYTTMRTNYLAWVSGFAPIATANPDRPHLSEAFADSLRTLRADIALAVLRAIIESDHRRDVARLRQPVLIIQAMEDMFVPPQVNDFLQRTIPNNRLVVVNATGHFPHVSAPNEVVAAMRAFI